MVRERLDLTTPSIQVHERNYFCSWIDISSMMSRSNRSLFYSAFISGAALRLGLPGLSNLIMVIWETTRPVFQQILVAELQIMITLASLAVFLIATYFTWEIYIKGIKKGRKGLIIVLLGVTGGFVLVSLVIGSLEAMITGSILY
jgi:hypothetical protein